MKIDNQSFGIDNNSCGALENPLFASAAAGWRRGYAADCKSVREISKNVIDFGGMSLNGHSAKTTGQTVNESRISQTLSGWWLIPAAVIGAALWVRIIGAVL